MREAITAQLLVQRGYLIDRCEHLVVRLALRAAGGELRFQRVVGTRAPRAVLHGCDIGTFKGCHEGAEAWECAGNDAVVHFNLCPSNG